ncbi:hypothetical protein [Pseudomonas fluorescens]|uniref:Lipoprotein n=1 Tax=Pseudomonas fluorescens TaxID=294 RepID=A0A5E7G6T9_PSEFL|nr:hypothetical protein [Pseudomonas fluorescens]VVO44743.1 hypothetical protein PS723_06422 [Pseudomonas fluorescens]
MKMFAGLGLAFLLISGCTTGEHPAPESAVPIAAKGQTAPRVKVGVSEKDKNLARAKALTGLEGKGWDFEPLYGTAADQSGRDLAVCGKARQHSAQATAYFAYYNGELILWDETETHGTSVENQFLSLICSYG